MVEPAERGEDIAAERGTDRSAALRELRIRSDPGTPLSDGVDRRVYPTSCSTSWCRTSGSTPSGCDAAASPKPGSDVGSRSRAHAALSSASGQAFIPLIAAKPRWLAYATTSDRGE
jgi:hypothetical protein